ncbi:MAG: sigma 54-interacting transcriptional regulator [Gemmatimonadetes bacterium]|nr:sigma 54-interacting transcriptional regulator [Gemmatimonadota bacterium]
MEERAARSSCTILITGETGVGKGFVAKWLHRLSLRASAPFVPVNCGAIPETLIDSQLFGHVRGAFSGATRDHVGLVRAAETGTLFLDEIAELPLSAQTRLLRVLQDQEVQPVGSARPVSVNVRIMAATNNNLTHAVREKRFREDLLFRLDVVRINIVPLRERSDEIEPLLAVFNQEFAELYRQPRLHFAADAMDLLMRSPWPGNVRQLRTVVERLHVLTPDATVTGDVLREIGHDVPLEVDTAVATETGQARRLEEVRHEEVLRVLDQNGGSVAKAAVTFGVHRSTIYRWLRSRGSGAAQPPSAGR